MKRTIFFTASLLCSGLLSAADAPRVTISAANTYFNSLAAESRVTIPAYSTGEISALAAGLENDPALIVAYVRNNFRYVPYYGHMKGPQEVLIDQSGNDYDLARLTIEMLRAAGHTAKYVRGTITYSPADVANWLEVSTGQISPLLADAGIPHNAPTGTAIAIERIWVQVDDATYVDPAFKAMSIKSGVNLGTLMGYNEPQLLSVAGGTTGTTWVSGVNTTNVETKLKTDATTLCTALKANYPKASMADIIGGSEIVPITVAKGDLASLAVSGTSSPTIFSSPDAKRMHTVTITVGTTAQIINLPDINGQIFCISSVAGSAQPAGQTPARQTDFTNAAALNNSVQSSGRYTFDPVIQGQKTHYFSYTVGKTRFNSSTGGSDSAQITGANSSAFRLAWTVNGGNLAINSGGVSNLSFATSASATSYSNDIHVFVSDDVAPGSYDGTLQITDYSIGRTPQETLTYSIPLFATVLPNHVVQLKVGSNVIWSDSSVAAASRVDSYPFKVSINHPYPANSGTLGDEVLSDTYNRKVFRGSKYVFLTQAGDCRWTNRRVSEPLTRCDQLLAGGASEQSEDVILNTLSAFGSQYLLETELMEETADRLAGIAHHNYHQFAIAKLEAGYTMDHILWNPWGVGRSGTVDPSNAYNVSDMMGSALEHGSSEELQDGASISTTKILYMANQQGQRIYKVDSTTLPSIQSELTGYSANDLTYLQQQADDHGYTYVLHQNGSTQLNDWKGYGYMATDGDVGGGMLIGGGFNFVDPTYGGVATVRYPYGFGWESFDGRRERLIREYLHRLYSARRDAASREPVDLKTGAYVYNMTELKVGTTAPPRGLDFQRSYDSNAAYLSGPLGRGWDHNWNSRLQVTTDPEMAIGMRQPADAAAWLVGAYTTYQMLATNQNTPKGVVIQAIASKWAVDQIKDSSVSVKLAGESVVFARQPDGTFSGQPGVKLTLQGNSTSGYLLKNRFGTTFAFNTSGQLTSITDIYNKTLTVTWTSDKVSTVKDCYGRQLTFNYGGDTLLDSVTDSTGRSLSFTYSGGNLATFTDPDGNVFQYTYDSGNRVQQVRNGENQLVASNHYDALGKVDYQDSEGDSARRWYYKIAPCRTVEQDPQGGRTIYEYDRFGRQLSQTDALGNRQTFEYDANNQLTGAVDAKLQRTEFEYDNQLNLTLTRRFKDGNPVTTSATYDSVGRQDSVTNANNFSVTRHFNSLNEKDWEDDPDSHRATYTYYPAANAAAGQVASITVPNESGGTFTTNYTYDSYGHPSRIDYPDTTYETFTYSPRGDLSDFGDRNHNHWLYSYNNRRLVSAETDPNTVSKLYTYNSYGKLLTYTDRNGHQTVNTYYPAGRIKDTTNAETKTTVYQYDSRDWQQAVVSPLLNSIQTTYYANGWINQVIDPLSKATTNFYQPNGNRYTSQNALLQNTVYGFDTLNRVESVIDTRTVETTSTHDNAGNTRFFLNGRTQQTETVFDKLNRVTDTYTPLRRHTHNDYSPRGLLTAVTEPSSQSAAFTYDQVGRVKTRTDGVGTTTYGYDSNGNLQTVVEGTKTLTRVYDNLNRLTLYRNADGEEIEYRYYPEGNLWKIIYPDKTKVVEYTYDGANHLKTVKDWNNRITTYGWDDDGRLTSISRPNGTSRVVGYDKAGRATSIRENGVSGKVIAYSRFGRDDIGRITNEIRAPRQQPFASVAATSGYDFDDRLTSYNGGTVTNDADGNMTYAPVSGTQWAAFAYDARNRLTSVDDPSTWQNVYDAEGTRVETIDHGVSTKYVVSPDALSKTLVQINPDGTRRYFVHGLGLLYHIDDADTTSVTTTYHYNAQGSTIALSNDAGAVTGRLQYDPYGAVVFKNGTINTIFQFDGHYGIATDSNGLVHLNARFYNPHLKRFMNSDPSGFAGGSNWFAYSSGDPVNQFDPLGLGAADSERYTWVDGVQDGISVLGLIPGLGAIPDGANSLVYLARGKYAEAGISALAMIPFVGDLALAGKYVEEANDVRKVVQGADEAAAATTDLYRAVGVTEYKDIMESGKFLPGPGSLEGRQFAHSYEEAMAFADIDPTKVAIMKTTVPTEALEFFDYSKAIDPHIFKEGVTTVQPGVQTQLFQKVMGKIEHVF